MIDPPKFTPAWMTMVQAARGWGVSKQHAYRIVRAEEKRLDRPMLQKGKIRTVDFLAVPRGESAAAPMIPEVAILWAKFDALAGQQRRIAKMLARLMKANGLVP